MAKKTTSPASAGEPEDATLYPTQVSAVAKDIVPGIIFRPGIAYTATAAVRAKLDAAGKLKKD